MTVDVHTWPVVACDFCATCIRRYVMGAQMPGARLPWWRLIYVDPKYGTSFVSPFWRLEFCSGSFFFFFEFGVGVGDLCNTMLRLTFKDSGISLLAPPKSVVL